MVLLLLIKKAWSPAQTSRSAYELKYARLAVARQAIAARPGAERCTAQQLSCPDTAALKATAPYRRALHKTSSPAVHERAARVARVVPRRAPPHGLRCSPRASLARVSQPSTPTPVHAWVWAGVAPRTMRPAAPQAWAPRLHRKLELASRCAGLLPMRTRLEERAWSQCCARMANQGTTQTVGQWRSTSAAGPQALSLQAAWLHLAPPAVSPERTRGVETPGRGFFLRSQNNRIIFPRSLLGVPQPAVPR